MATLTLEALSPELLPQVLDLDRLSLGAADQTLWSEDGYRREIDSPNSDLWVLRSADYPDRVLGLGCLWAILDEAHITTLAVHPLHRRQGLGQILLWSLLNSACQRTLAWATLEVRPSNESALRLYDKFGFQLVGQRKGYYHNPDEDAKILWCKGLQSSEVQQRLQSLQPILRQHLHHCGWIFSPYDMRSSQSTVT
jgi:[ribosomal protein S18]-alanine N-acetyltransferase